MNGRSKLQINESEQSGIAVVALAGELTLDDGDLAFGRYADQLIAAGKLQIVLDLSDVTYIDSAGVGMLVAKSKRVAERGGSIRLARLTPRSHHLMGMLKLKLVFEVYEDIEAAIRSFTWRAR